MGRHRTPVVPRPPRDDLAQHCRKHADAALRELPGTVATIIVIMVAAALLLAHFPLT